MVVFTCDQCKKRSASPAHRTVTGRELCRDCHDRLLGAAAGAMAAGTGVPATTTIASAAATSGLFSRRRRKRRAEGTETGGA